MNEFKCTTIEIIFTEQAIKRWAWWEKVYRWLGRIGRRGQSFGFILNGFSDFTVDADLMIEKPRVLHSTQDEVDPDKKRFSLVVRWPEYDPPGWIGGKPLV